MKKNILLTIITLVATMFATSCQKEWSEEVAAAQHEAVVNEWHVRPVDGNYVRGQHYESTHYCHSTYRIFGGDVEANVADLQGCYDVANDGTVANTNLYLNFVEDKVESAIVNIAGIPDPVDYSNRFRPCHYTPFQICFDTEAKKIRVYGVNEEEGDTCVATGDWYGVIVHNDTTVVVEHDTVILHDTTFVHDTVNHRDTITVTDTIFVHDSVVTTNTVQYVVEHLYWNQNVQLINGKLYVSGTDKVTKNVYNNGVLVSTASVNYNHRSRFAIAGFNGVVYNQAVNNCEAIVNGAATINGHSFQIIWEADEIVGNVIVGGDNVTNQLVACHATASQLCATSDGHLVIHFVDGNDEIATYTTTYTVNTPTGSQYCKGVSIVCGFTGYGYNQTPYVVSIYKNGNTYWARYTTLANAGDTTSYTTVNITAAQYNYWNARKDNANVSICYIQQTGEIGIVTFNSDQNEGFMYTNLDGVNRQHIDQLSLPTGVSYHNPCHAKNVNGGYLPAGSVHGISYGAINL